MEFIETHRIWCTCFRGRFRPGIGTDSVGPGFGLVIGSTSVSSLEVECCASNHIHVSSQCPNTFPEIRELLRQMGSGEREQADFVPGNSRRLYQDPARSSRVETMTNSLPHTAREQYKQQSTQKLTIVFAGGTPATFRNEATRNIEKHHTFFKLGALSPSRWWA